MPKRIVVNLSPEQYQDLVTIRDRHPKAFLRERAAAVLKVSEGRRCTEVAEHGLLKRHEPETVHGWIKRYLEHGVKGWQGKAGRGRKPAFSPLDRESAHSQLNELLHRPPQTHSRWRLRDLQHQVAWLRSLSLAGIWMLLKRLTLVYKRGREYLHSPDADYDLKCQAVAHALTQVRADLQRYVMVYQDELTYYRRPTVSRAYEQRGQHQARVSLGHRANSKRRISGSLNVLTGHLFVWQRAHLDRHTLKRFYAALQDAYPQAERIFLVQDNWPVYKHPDLMTWVASSRITVLFLPTYAPWTNPIEKVWLRLKQQVLHHHPFTDDWTALQTAVQSWLDQFRDGSLDLLHAVGLSPS